MQLNQPNSIRFLVSEVNKINSLASNVLMIVQARMTSTRLPGKILREVLGKPLLEHQIERLLRVKLASSLVIATTTNDTDQPVEDLCLRLGVKCFRGSEEDVLARFYGAAFENEADVVVRLTGDCPVIDPLVIDKVIAFYLENTDCFDYVSNVFPRTYPRGMDTEVFPFRAIKEAYNKAQTREQREHVTPFIHQQPERYKIGNVIYNRDTSLHRWTVDTPEDFELIKRIIENLYPVKPDYTMEDILNLFELNPDWQSINAHIEQKKLSE